MNILGNHCTVDLHFLFQIEVFKICLLVVVCLVDLHVHLFLTMSARYRISVINLESDGPMARATKTKPKL